MKKNNKENVKRILVSFLMALICSLIISGCGKEEITGDIYQVYYISIDDNSVISQAVGTEIDDTEELVLFLAKKLQETPDDTQMAAVLDENTGYLGIELKGYQATVDFDDRILQLPNYKTVLIRAALTRTLTQVKGVSTVCCNVNGEPMTDSTGMPIGPMTANTFIENAGTQINPDEDTVLTLYFSSEDGNNLVKVKRNVTYSSNISLDKLVLEQLLVGPLDGENGYPVMNSDTKVIGVTTQDGTCYVNLSSAFLNSVGNISTEVAIYSIVDSLIELGNVNKVQFYIDGEADVTFRETVNFTTQFSRNLDITYE